MKTPTLALELLDRIDAYWRAADYLSVGQIYLFDNPLLRRPLTLADVRRPLSNWARCNQAARRGEHSAAMEGASA